MKRILRGALLVLVLIALLLPVLPMGVAFAFTTQDSYIPADNQYWDVYGVKWQAQTFTTGSAYTITRVGIKIFREGDPGDMTISIRATSSDVPVTPDLAVTAAISTAGITESTSGAWYYYNFPAGASLSTVTKYSIVVRTASGNSTNKIGWRTLNSGGGYSGGSFYQNTNSGANGSWDDKAVDGCFITYSGFDVPTVTTGFPTGIEGTTATVWAYLDADGGIPTTVSFLYGLTTDYGSATAGSVTAQGAWTSKGITGLTPGATYHYKSKAVSAEGTVYGADKTLRTTNFSVGEIDTNLDYTGFTVSSERSIFYTKGLYWIFYIRTASPAGYGAFGVQDAVYQQLGYRTYNGSTFSAFTPIRSVPGSGGEHTSIWFDGTYFHYVTPCAPYVYYRSGTPNDGGSVTWRAPEQIVTLVSEGGGWKHPSLTTDSYGYPIIGYSESPSGDSSGVAIRSTSNTGYWITDATFTRAFGDSNTDPKVIVLPLTAGKAYAIVSNHSEPIRGYLWNGSAWSTAEVATAITTDTCFNTQALSVNDNVYVATRSKTSPTYHPFFAWRDSADSTWKGETDIYSATTSQGVPGLAYDSTSNLIYIFYARYDTDIIYAVPWDNGVLGTPFQVTNESTGGLTSAFGGGGYISLQSPFYTLGGSLPLVYLALDSGQYNPTVLKLTLTPIPEAPEVTTDLPTDMVPGGATLHGTLVDDNGYATSVRFQWGTTLAYGNATDWEPGYTDGQAFSYALEGLTESTTYHYRAQGKWADDTIGRGIDRTFTTTAIVYVETFLAWVTDIAPTTATLHASTTWTAVTDWGFKVSDDFEATWDTYLVGSTLLELTTFDYHLTGLGADSIYHFKAYVSESAWRQDESEVVSFMTLQPNYLGEDMAGNSSLTPPLPEEPGGWIRPPKDWGEAVNGVPWTFIMFLISGMFLVGTGIALTKYTKSLAVTFMVLGFLLGVLCFWPKGGYLDWWILFPYGVVGWALLQRQSDNPIAE